MKYLVRSVHQMTAAEVQQYVALFNRIFDKQLTTDEFHYKFSRQFGDDSYFSLMVDEGRGIVGSVGAIEVPYMWRGRRLLFGLTVDGMIDPSFRGDFLTLKRLHNSLVAELSTKGVVFIFTKPNDNSYLYLKKMLNLYDLEVLKVYAFPLQLFRFLNRRLGWLDRLSLFTIDRIASRQKSFRDISLHQIAETMLPSAEPEPYAHRLRDAEFYRRRYGSPVYRYAALDDKFVIYRMMKFGDRHAGFIMEASPLARMEWLSFASHLTSFHGCIDVMLQIDSGTRHHRPFFHVPRRFLPDKLNIVGKILSPSMMPADVIFSMRLSDFEVV